MFIVIVTIIIKTLLYYCQIIQVDKPIYSWYMFLIFWVNRFF